MCNSSEAIYTSKGDVELRTNIEIDDALLAEAMAATGLRTKRKVVEAGLQLLARHKHGGRMRRSCSGASDGRAISIDSA